MSEGTAAEPTGDEYRTAAKVFRTHGSRELGRRAEIVAWCEAQADRLDREDARDAAVEELAHALAAAAVPVANDMHGFYRREAQAALAHLQPVAEWLAAEKVWEASFVRITARLADDDSPWCLVPLGIAFGPVRSATKAVEERINQLLGRDGYRVTITLDEPPQADDDPEAS